MASKIRHAKVICRHCRKLKANYARRLCRGCHAGHAHEYRVILNTNQKGSGIILGIGKPPAFPTLYLPGTFEKLAVMRHRAANGERIHHAKDARRRGYGTLICSVYPNGIPARRRIPELERLGSADTRLDATEPE